MITEIIDKNKQTELTPDAVLKDLMDGNKRFTGNKMYERDYASQIEKTTGGQWPQAVVLGCIDSRVPLETIFDQGVGDIFAARVAGNFENTDILGSMEYSCKVAGSKLVMVLGHESCGAVKAACDNVELGNITHLLSNIKPAVETTKTDGERNSKNDSFVAGVVENNVKLTMDRIREKSPILKEMEDNGEIKIVGGVYSISTGKVTLL
ncbi:carbonic anhydrase family protein [Christiangramia sp. SM2212]|uniref:Carbonic anhydrase family protein n=1 Tax=Christiangramia sediminicola TaxID=3073267 RepID=A0ABU1ES72_9FLAO|nr:carbonic anhydrase family protein [Christiangramia sp. SM2212]MDR5591244.1 carbonic anhydrase family protein [Christiangramia sp. SM2212]